MEAEFFFWQCEKSCFCLHQVWCSGQMPGSTITYIDLGKNIVVDQKLIFFQISVCDNSLSISDEEEIKILRPGSQTKIISPLIVFRRLIERFSIMKLYPHFIHVL